MADSKIFADGGLVARTDAGIGTLTLDRPARKNAVTNAMWHEIPQAIEWLAGSSGARVIVLGGGGTTDFSAGADISEFDVVRKDAQTARIYEAANSAAFAAIRTAPVPMIAAIRGICFGGAFGLAAACDIRIAEEGARFAVPASRLGLAYPPDAVGDLVAALGPQRARYLMMTAQEMDTATAYQAGFLLEVLKGGQLEERIRELAGLLAHAAPLSVAASRAAVAASLTSDRERLAAAAALGDKTFESADYAEGRAAFREKRKPVFTGK